MRASVVRGADLAIRVVGYGCLLLALADVGQQAPGCPGFPGRRDQGVPASLSRTRDRELISASRYVRRIAAATSTVAGRECFPGRPGAGRDLHRRQCPRRWPGPGRCVPGPGRGPGDRAGTGQRLVGEGQVEVTEERPAPGSVSPTCADWITRVQAPSARPADDLRTCRRPVIPNRARCELSSRPKCLIVEFVPLAASGIAAGAVLLQLLSFRADA
jgi:hypothetical protein